MIYSILKSIRDKQFTDERGFLDSQSLMNKLRDFSYSDQVYAVNLAHDVYLMDDLIFQEFKGTGNMELILDRRLAERRIWPAIDIAQSGTRREELLYDQRTLQTINLLRRTLNNMNPFEAIEQLTKQLLNFSSNEDFIKLISNAKILG
jgi:transcription termination factor Rho